MIGGTACNFLIRGMNTFQIKLRGEKKKTQVSSDKLRELDEQAALDELVKLHNMEVIQPVVLTLEQAAQENTVDTTLVSDWRFRGRWCLKWK